MGEVYRADDLKLGQTVALKFLPAAVEADPSRLERLLNEVRVARQVSHPSVCRVYDVAEADGMHFVSMEYVDGEDLQTLLRRIGRLPQEKALQIARELCLGLAAVHERGILHRDLKPANVMIDGRGRVRITDFGIAGLSADVAGREARSGTPAYMAPELFAGLDPSAASDIFALGVTLYELFTGKAPFQGDTLAELQRSRKETTPTLPSEMIEGLDPAIERAILRCLDKDPARRPPSALAVSAALPGGDPLAAALAAGETPSPELVAAAGETGTLSPRAVLVVLAGICAAGALFFWLGGRTGLLQQIPPPKSTAALLDRTTDIIKTLGYTEEPAAAAHGFGWHRSYLEHLRDTDSSPRRWDRLAKPRPTAVYLWYRQSPRPLVPANVGGIVNLDDPAPVTPGMINTMIAANGDLWHFEAVPPQTDDGLPPASTPDWGTLFTAAGLRIDEFGPAATRWVPPTFGDARVAWEGGYRDAPEFRVHVEAASYRGRPVFFHVFWPWNRPLRAQPFEDSPSTKAANLIVLILGISALLVGLVLARRNLRLGRVDRKGAFRLAACFFWAGLLASLGASTHVPSPAEEWGLLVRHIALALFGAGFVWLGYIAMEPLVRRRWPEGIISWTRLLAGRAADPLVGRDALAGACFGIGMSLVNLLPVAVPEWIGRAPEMPAIRELDLVGRPSFWVAAAANALTQSVSQGLVLLIFLFLTRRYLRSRWLSAAAFLAVGFAIFALALWEAAGPYALLLAVASTAMYGVALFRFGLVGVTAAFFVFQLLAAFPFGRLGWSDYDLPGLFALLVLAAFVAFAARAALGGRSLLDLGGAEN
jgi:serine/threonine-protein kinase